jgi:hypothetical protein
MKPVDEIRSVSLSPEGRFFSPTLGYGSEYLVAVYTLNQEEVVFWAPLEVKYSGPLLLGLRREDARSRQVPDPHKNQVRAVALTDGGVVLAHQAIPLFKKFSRSGDMLWRVEQDHPILQEIRNEVFDLTLEESGPRAYSIRYWRDGIADGRGGCYLLVNRGDRLRVIHLQHNGVLVGPIEGPDGNFSKLVHHGDRLWACDRSIFRIIILELVKTSQKPD